MKKNLILICFHFCYFTYAQKIDFYFPHFAGKTYDFVIFQGDKQQTIIQGTIPANGNFTIQIPKEYAPYTGMSRWLITNSPRGGGLDMLVPGKDFSVSCEEAEPTEKNIIYKNNVQNKELNDIYKQQQNIIARYNAMQLAMKSFSKTDKNYSVFEQEHVSQKMNYKSLQASLSRNPNYVKELIRIINAAEGVDMEIFDDKTIKADNIAKYIAKEMDLKILFTSGYWTSIISAWVNIHTQVLQDPYRFVEDFLSISNKITNPTQYTDFVGRTTYYLNEQGKDSYISGVTPWVLASGKITNYNGSLAIYLKGAIGMQAADLVFTKHLGNLEEHNHETTILKSSELAGNDYQKTLLVFYESGCGPCENLLQQLLGNYEFLKKQGMRIVSISADKDETAYKNKQEGFPWKKDAFCDYEGIKGVNFVNYAVSGTPTMLLLDKTGKIILRTASFKEVLYHQ